MTPAVFSGLCVLFIVMAVPLVLGKVPPNCVYGFRTRKTLSSETVWYKANKFFGVGLVLSSTASLFFFAAALLFPEAIPAYFVRQVAGLVLVLPLGVLIAVSAVYLSTL